MKDVNKPLRETIFPALQATGVSPYYMQAPDGLEENYIVFSSLSSSPIAMKSGSTVTVNTQITIFTKVKQYNSGDEVDIIAGKIYLHIYPHSTFVLDMPTGFQMVSTDFVSDTVNNWTIKNQLVEIDRTIVFQHKIYIQ